MTTTTIIIIKSHVRHENVGDVVAGVNFHEDHARIKEFRVNALGGQEATAHDVDLSGFVSR